MTRKKELHEKVWWVIEFADGTIDGETHLDLSDGRYWCPYLYPSKKVAKKILKTEIDELHRRGAQFRQMRLEFVD